MLCDGDRVCGYGGCGGDLHGGELRRANVYGGDLHHDDGGRLLLPADDPLDFPLHPKPQPTLGTC